MKLSVLDLAGVLEDTIELARHTDALGFARYWVADARPQPTPLLHVAILAGITERIRVGTAGLVFDYYAALRTAHDFHFLERAYPGRIDAGFSGEPVIPPLEDLEGRTPEDVVASHPARVRRLVRRLRDTPDAPDHDASLAWVGTMAAPQLWSLGGGALAAELDVGFAHSLLHADAVDDPAAIARPAAVVVAGVCAETTAEAERIAATVRGATVPRIIGDRARCRDQLAALAARYAVDEVVFADLCPDLAARQTCYARLAG